MEDEALQQLRVQTIGVFYQLIGVITIFGQPQIKSSVTEVMVQVKNQHSPRIRLGERSTELRHYCGYAASALGADECQNLSLGLLFLFPATSSDSRYRV